MALQKGQRLREVGQFEVAEVGQIKSAGDTVSRCALAVPPAAFLLTRRWQMVEAEASEVMTLPRPPTI
ncbi:hypothetical protein XcvCFBP7113P_09255 [Xanthomonas citri pv. vignicola]|nr:hypothetical protein XcvCFBP7113P_09255 [Xanthomonas citri pv. vignicola]